MTYYFITVRKSKWNIKWAAARQINKMTCAPNEDTDHHGHPSSLTRVFLSSMGSPGQKASSCGKRNLWTDWADGVFDGPTGHLVCIVVVGLRYMDQKPLSRSGWQQILLVFGIKDINSHFHILNIASINYYQVKHFENIDSVFQKHG